MPPLNTTDSKYDLNSQFAADIEALKRTADALANQHLLNEETARGQFTQAVDSRIETITAKVRLENDDCPEAVQMKLGQSKETLATLEENRSNLVRQKASHLAEAEDRRRPWVYLGIYGLLLGAMFAAAALTAEMLFPEQGRVLAWITSVVFIGGSYLVNHLYWGITDEAERARFFRKLNRYGLWFFLGIAMAFALGRAAILIDFHLSQANAGASFLTQPASNGIVVGLQYATPISAFIFMVLLELAFSSSLLITVYKRLRPQIDLNAIEANLQETEADITSEMAQIGTLTAQLSKMEHEEAYLKAFGDQTRADLMTDLEIKMAEAHAEALRKIMSLDREKLGQALILSQPHISPQLKEGEFYHENSIPENGHKHDHPHTDDRPF